MSVSLKTKIESERGKRKASEVHELILDNSHAANLDGLTSEYENLELLSLVSCELGSLKGLPKLPKLRRLELSDNKLADGLDVLVESCSALTHLNLSGNKFETVDLLKPLAALKHLTHVDLFNCPVTEHTDYRKKLFDVLPSLVYLDGTNRDGDDEPDEDSEGNEVNDEEEEDYEEDDEEEPGLKALADGDLEDEDEDDFDPGNEEEDDEEDEEEEDAGKRGTKRKHREEEDEEDGDGDGDDDDE